MRFHLTKALLVVSALALTGCGTATEEEYPAVEDVGVDDGSSQDLPELEAAEAATAEPAAGTTDEPTDDGGSQDDEAAAGKP